MAVCASCFTFRQFFFNLRPGKIPLNEIYYVADFLTSYVIAIQNLNVFFSAIHAGVFFKIENE